MNVLVFAPHPDDEVLGCGGTIAKLAEEGHSVHVCIMTQGTPPLFSENALEEQLPQINKANEIIGTSKIHFLKFPAVMMESVQRYDINQKVLDLVLAIKPEMVFIPHFGDMQKDHEITANSVMVAIRPVYAHVVKRVYAYETLSETEWNLVHSKNAFLPNVFFDISSFISKKLDALKSYDSQLRKFPHPRSLEAIKALAEYRGSTMNCEAAEAFMLVREYQ